jgi:hypothetical protein
MTAKEKYDHLEEKKLKIENETLALYAKIDELRKKSGALEAEIRDAFKAYLNERKTK